MAQGVKPGNPVAICFDRTLAMVEGMLAILKAGGVYVPIDPSYPQDRVQYMMEDTSAPVLLTSQEYSARFDYLAAGKVTRVLEREGLDAELAQQPETNLKVELAKGSRSLAYIIYTSGSTGKPKGVCVPQMAVSRLVLNTDYVNLQPGHRMGHASNVSFDAATFVFWGALLNGGTLVGIDKDTTLNPDAFAQVIKGRKIDVLFVTTALFNVLSRQMPDVFSNLQYLLFGGEACDPNQVRAVLNQSGGPAHLLHVYGPTENTTYSTWYNVKDVLPGATTVPIGYPLANSTLFVLDDQLRPVPAGVPGEIYVGGMGVADGYLNRPELTREAFLIDPFNSEQRIYKTGDLGRFLENGALEILGRIDDQVKIRGFRIELGEVETAVNQLPGIRETSVVVREDANGNRQLVAYCEKEPGQTLLPVAELKAKLKQHLPDYMVPSAIVMLDHLPITPNGKVDKRALPAPAAEDYASNAYVAARNPVEEALAAIWREVLGVAQVGAFDDFFELGGHSLLITKVSTRIKQQLGVELPLRTLFEVPTIAALAEIIQAVSFVPANEVADDDGDEEFEEGSL